MFAPPGPIVAMRAFATVDSERARESKARDALRKQQARVETVEKFSGLRIRNRVVASMVLEDKFADLRFARIPDLRHDFPGRWATAGVLVDKSVKQSSSGTSYSVWKLSDLTPNDNCVTVFLFGQAHLDHHREPEGTIWTVVDGKLREDAKSARPSVACDHESMITKIGTSPDFARCKGTRRDGGNCTMHVNRSASEFCAFHAASALKSLATERMALGPGRAPKFVRNGQTVMGTKGAGGRPNAPPTASRDHAASRRAMDGPSRAYTEEEKRRMAASQMGKSALGRGAAMVGGVGGARAFPGMATDTRTGRAAGRALGMGIGPNGKTMTSRAEVEAQKRAREAAARAAAAARAGDGFARFASTTPAPADSGLNGGFPTNAPRPRPADGPRAAPAPPAKKIRLEEMDDAEFFGEDLDAVRKAQAVAKTLRAHDPNAWRKPLQNLRVNVRAAEASRPRIKGLLDPEPPAARRPAETSRRGSERETGRVDAAAPAPGSFGDVFGDIAASAMDGKSRYETEAETLEAERMMATLGALEKQDNLHAQVTKTFVLTVRASKCECGKIFERRPPDACHRAGHRAKAIEVKKRFFKCGACPFRTQTLNRPFPSKPCPKCRCEDWLRACVSAAAERVAAGRAFGEEVATRENMLPRGVEHDFALNSLGGGGGWSKDEQPEVV